MKLTYEITEQDYINFNVDHYNGTKSVKITLWSMKLVFPIFFLASLVFVGAMGVDLYELIPEIVAVTFFCAAWIAFSSKIFGSSIKRSVKRLLKGGKANDFIGEQSLELKEDCMEQITPGTTNQTDYKIVEKVLSGHGLYYIYIGAMQAIILPMSAFKDDEEKSKFFAILKDKTGISA